MVITRSLNDMVSASTATHIQLGSCATDIIDGAFSGYTNITEIGSIGSGASVEIPNSLATIGKSAFRNCTSLTSVTIPDSVTTISESVFGYSGLKSVTIPDSVTTIDAYAFRDCSSLTSVTIGSGVTSFDNSAFSGCTSLSAAYLNSDAAVSNLVNDSFRSVLTAVTIGDSATIIGYKCFSGCTNLTSVHIRNGVTIIDGNAFRDCSSLTNITIPDSVRSIGGYAFEWCNHLTSVTCLALTPPTLGNNYVFDHTNNCPIYVPSESYDLYINAENWSGYASRIQPIPNS